MINRTKVELPKTTNAKEAVLKIIANEPGICAYEISKRLLNGEINARNHAKVSYLLKLLVNDGRIKFKQDADNISGPLPKKKYYLI